MCLLQEVRGLREECLQEESKYHYTNCMIKVRQRKEIINFPEVFLYQELTLKLSLFT